MKAEELMIGDYVHVKPSGMLIKVTAVHRKKVAYNAVINKLAWVRESLLQPIPLERIHLIKNGFRVREDTDDTEYFYYDGYTINVDFYEGLPEDDIPPTIFLSIDFAEKDIAMPIEYVHELQQAMRIMGCDKEIEI